ncbi:MAG: response regulator [Limisphaerales bacterium]
MKKNILIVDDDAGVRDSLKKVLHNAGYQVVLAAGGLEAIAHVQSHAIDLILLDIRLPNQNGWETCQHFARAHPSVPVIVMTGESGQFKAALSAGASALMEKPLDAERLLQVVQELLTKSMELDPYRSRGIFYYVAASAGHSRNTPED